MNLTAPKKRRVTPPFSFSLYLYINRITMKKNIIVSEEQLRILSNKLKNVNENKESHSMAKKQLFTIATLANKMWESMDDNEELEDWQESKIAQSEQSIIAVVKSFMYDEIVDKPKGLEGINLDDIVIGQ